MIRRRPDQSSTAAVRSPHYEETGTRATRMMWLPLSTRSGCVCTSFFQFSISRPCCNEEQKRASCSRWCRDLGRLRPPRSRRLDLVAPRNLVAVQPPVGQLVDERLHRMERAFTSVRAPNVELGRSVANRSVNLLAQDVRMPGVTRCLLDHVHIDPTQRDLA